MEWIRLLQNEILILWFSCMNFSLYQIPRYVIINFILEPIQGRNCLSTRHHSWKTGFDSRSGHAENLKNDTCGLSSLVLRVDGRVHGNSSRAVLPLTRHQCRIHCESRRVTRGASKRRCALQTTRETPKGIQKLSINEIDHYICLSYDNR